jgi:multidrug efflux pump
MTIGTFFTLFIVPSVYVLLAKDHRKERVALGLEVGEDPHPVTPGVATAAAQ